MSNIQKVSDAIVKQGILPLYFNADENVTIEILRSIYKAGIRAVEYTNRGEAALRNFKKMVEVRNAEMSDLLLGIGTIKIWLQQKISLMQVQISSSLRDSFPKLRIFLSNRINFTVRVV